jgi:redox-sensitive bicupin YhaK (pirin superfamily)
MSNFKLHKSDTRGAIDLGLLKARHSFSFGSYYNPERIHFGVLRVLNDDLVAPSMGFNTHPHDNMEIITIPLEGAIRHKDSMGNEAVVKEGEVQVMSAGTGIKHSEHNASLKDHLKLLQIWILPNKKNVEPRYQQISLDKAKMNNTFYQIVSPNQDDEGVWIHQNAWFYLADINKGNSLSYALKSKENGVYIFVIDGSLSISDYMLEQRDALGITTVEDIQLSALSDSKVLLMELSMFN